MSLNGVRRLTVTGVEAESCMEEEEEEADEDSHGRVLWRGRGPHGLLLEYVFVISICFDI